MQLLEGLQQGMKTARPGFGGLVGNARKRARVSVDLEGARKGGGEGGLRRAACGGVGLGAGGRSASGTFGSGSSTCLSVVGARGAGEREVKSVGAQVRARRLGGRGRIGALDESPGSQGEYDMDDSQSQSLDDSVSFDDSEALRKQQGAVDPDVLRAGINDACGVLACVCCVCCVGGCEWCCVTHADLCATPAYPRAIPLTYPPNHAQSPTRTRLHTRNFPHTLSPTHVFHSHPPTHAHPPTHTPTHAHARPPARTTTELLERVQRNAGRLQSARAARAAAASPAGQSFFSQPTAANERRPPLRSRQTYNVSRGRASETISHILALALTCKSAGSPLLKSPASDVKQPSSGGRRGRGCERDGWSGGRGDAGPASGRKAAACVSEDEVAP